MGSSRWAFLYAILHEDAEKHMNKPLSGEVCKTSTFPAIFKNMSN